VSISAELEASLPLSDMEEGPAKTAAVSAASKKLLKDRMQDVQLVESNAASSIKWAPGEPSGEMLKDWQELSVPSRAQWLLLADYLLILLSAMCCLQRQAACGVLCAGGLAG
jgi:hypothetical protein